MPHWLAPTVGVLVVSHMTAAVVWAIPLPASALGAWSLQGFAQGDTVIEADRDTVRQRPRLALGTVLRGQMGNQVQSLIDVRGVWGGPPVHADGIGLINSHDAFQDLSPAVELEEAYADFNGGGFDLRLGKQKFAWGRLDVTHAIDILNPRRFSDPFRIEPEDAKIGVPAAQLAYSLPRISSTWLDDFTAVLMWIPWRVPFRFPLSDERWFSPAANVPESIVVPPGAFGIGIGSTISTQLRETNVPPALQLDEGSVALRFNGVSRGVDWSLIAYNGAETNPALNFTTTVTAPIVRTKLAHGTQPILADLRQLDGSAVLTPRYGRILGFGGDLAFTLGAATLRAEFLYARDRFVPRRTDDLLGLPNLQKSICGDAACSGVTPIVESLLAGNSVAVDLGELFVRRNTIEWGVGTDYPLGAWTALLQINQTVLIDDNDNLLVPRIDTRLLAAVRRTFFAEQLELEIMAQQGMPRSYSSAMVRWSYALSDAARLRWGYLLLAGTKNSLVGQYQDNDEAFFDLRYDF